MSILDNQQKLDLQNLIKANETEDVTEHIRKSKQSNLIRDDIKQLLFLKQKYTRLSKSNPGEFDKMCVSQCQFLFNNILIFLIKLKLIH